MSKPKHLSVVQNSAPWAFEMSESCVATLLVTVSAVSRGGGGVIYSQ